MLGVKRPGSRGRAGFRTTPFCCCLLLVHAVLFVSGAAGGVRAPLAGAGDFYFVADLPTRPVEDGGRFVDLLVRIDHEQVRPDRAPDRWQRRVAVAWKLAREGVVAVDTLQVFEIQGSVLGADAQRIAFDLLEISSRVGPGRWAATITCTLLGDETQTARANGVLDVPDRAFAGVRIGDPEFRVRSGGLSLPHPERLYGVVQDTLEVYYEILGAVPGQRVAVQFAVRDPQHGGMDEQTLWIEGSGARTAHLYQLPLGSFPEGVYELGMRVLDPAGETGPETSADFVVSWRLQRSTQRSDDVLVEANLLLPSEEYERFKRFPRAAQSQRMQEFWNEHDPTPGTAANENYERFRERVAHAERFYGEARTPGPLTPRGRIYIRYGEPSEVQVQVVPADGADLEEAIERVHDTFAMPVEGVIGREQKSNLMAIERRGVAQEVQRDLLRNRARIGQEGSFELWIYEGNGSPLFDEWVGWSENIDLRFLFVDRLGVGRYELDFSNLPSRRE